MNTTSIERIESMSMDVETFEKIEDPELKKFVFLHSSVYETQKCRRVDNEEKIGFYRFTRKARINLHGKIYAKDTLSEYIVYNKKTKKVSMSKFTGSILTSKFLTYYFRSSFLWSLCQIKLSNTLVKKVVQGKICTLRDILKYMASYVFRNKDLKPETIYKYILAGRSAMLYHLTDANDVDPSLVPVRTNDCIIWKGKFKMSEFDNLKSEYEKWKLEQTKKYDSLKGLGIAAPGPESVESI